MRLRVGEQKIWKWETVVEGRERELNWGLSDLLLVSNVQSSVRACAFKHDVWTGCSPSWNKNSSNDSLPLNPPRQEHPNNWMLNCPRVPKTSMDSSNVVNTSLSYVNSVTTAASQHDKLFDEAKSFVCLWDCGKKCKWITYNEEVCTLVWKMKHSEKKKFGCGQWQQRVAMRSFIQSCSLHAVTHPCDHWPSLPSWAVIMK